MPHRSDNKEFVEALARGLEIIRAFHAHKPIRTVSDLSSELDLARPTVHRILQTLTELGYVVQTDQGYYLTAKVIELGVSYIATRGFYGAARPHMEQLASDIDQAVTLCELTDADIVVIGRAEVPKIVAYNAALGQKLPAHSTALGRVLLAGLDDEELMQRLDAYDLIEAVAAQPWVKFNKVGMVGISYPGISQLFAASTQPPSLAAITPLSVLDDSYRATLYPGGILNTGFAVKWTSERVEQSKPLGQGWEQKQIDSGDTTCADNQKIRGQNPDLLKEIEDNPYYSEELGSEINPRSFIGSINVPVFIAGAWQDEQTGGRFATMLDQFTSSPQVYAYLTNGLH
ncbi:MAG: hypothetical protein RIT23_1102, partial [Actinomycetota bacterium]